jgi:hypothetical protein
MRTALALVGGSRCDEAAGGEECRSGTGGAALDARARIRTIVRAHLDEAPARSYLFVTHYLRVEPYALAPQEAMPRDRGTASFRALE